MDLLVYDPLHVSPAACEQDPKGLAPPPLTSDIRRWLTALGRWAEVRAKLTPRASYPEP